MGVNLNSLGLLLDIIGAAFLFLFGLPPAINRRGHSFFLLEGIDEVMKERAARYDLLARVGLSLLIGGFALQLVSNFVE